MKDGLNCDKSAALKHYYAFKVDRIINHYSCYKNNMKIGTHAGLFTIARSSTNTIIFNLYPVVGSFISIKLQFQFFSCVLIF